MINNLDKTTQWLAMAQVQTPCQPSHFRCSGTGILPPEKECLLALKTVARLFSWPHKIQKIRRTEAMKQKIKRNTTRGLKTLPTYVWVWTASISKLLKSPVVSGDSTRSVSLCQRWRPDSETKTPGSETKTPGSETKTPDSETKNPGSETKTPGPETKNIRKLKNPGS